MTVLEAGRADLVPLYDRLAPVYDRLHHRWLRRAGGEAQAALEAAVRAALGPGQALLDAGCGTGAFARRLLADGCAADLTLLDPSREMLRRCADIPCERVHGRLEALPFGAETFDIVTCAWALETVAEPAAAIVEMARVLRGGGLLCVAFCAQRPDRGVADWMIRRSLTRRGTGRFLSVRGVARTIAAQGSFEVRSVPLAGPAAMVVARRVPGSPR
ncbi:methyltransferase domain-containing protein [uncultured Roseobacter sp.]|uniref:class I SAM-dependent methyltransferase n=1 Tax=uncultured Roseobacter sp. TaxID=114847 RepID=UPI00261AD5C4|nr:methyltransferase domain-containing protein [uncultured Roseobacter sp.]